MEWPLILALALLLPCVLMPAFFIWYLNRGGVTVSVKFARTRPVAGEPEDRELDEYEQLVLADLKRYLQQNPPVPE